MKRLAMLVGLTAAMGLMPTDGSAGIDPTLPVQAVVLNADGYYSSGGYFFSPSSSVAYTRKDNWAWYQPGYVRACYNGGCYVQGYYPAGYWYFTGYTYTPVLLTPTTDRQVILGIMAARATVQNRMAKDMQDQANTIELIREAGLSGNFAFQGYYGGRLTIPNPLAVGVLQQGNTVYGVNQFSYQQTRDAYGQTDPNISAQAAAFLGRQAGENAGAAFQGNLALAREINAASAQIAAIRAQGEIGRLTQDGIKGIPQTTTTTKISGSFVGPPWPPAALPAPERMPRADEVPRANRQGVKENFRIADVPNMSAPQVLKVLEWCVAEPGKKPAMPKDGEPLTAEEIRLHFMGGTAVKDVNEFLKLSGPAKCVACHGGK